MLLLEKSDFVGFSKLSFVDGQESVNVSLLWMENRKKKCRQFFTPRTESKYKLFDARNKISSDKYIKIDSDFPSEKKIRSESKNWVVEWEKKRKLDFALNSAIQQNISLTSILDDADGGLMYSSEMFWLTRFYVSFFYFSRSILHLHQSAKKEKIKPVFFCHSLKRFSFNNMTWVSKLWWKCSCDVDVGGKSIHHAWYKIIF